MNARITRRQLVSGAVVLGAGAVAIAITVPARSLLLGPASPKAPLVGILGTGAADGAGAVSQHNSLLRGLREQGLVEGRDLVFEFRFAGEQPERLPELAAELVRAGVRMIVTGGPAMTGAARQVTDRVPIVTSGGPDPTVAGWAVSLARPGGNVTGVAHPGPELFGKGVELLSGVAGLHAGF